MGRLVPPLKRLQAVGEHLVVLAERAFGRTEGEFNDNTVLNHHELALLGHKAVRELLRDKPRVSVRIGNGVRLLFLDGHSRTCGQLRKRLFGYADRAKIELSKALLGVED